MRPIGVTRQPVRGLRLRCPGAEQAGRAPQRRRGSRPPACRARENRATKPGCRVRGTSRPRRTAEGGGQAAGMRWCRRAPPGRRTQLGSLICAAIYTARSAIGKTRGHRFTPCCDTVQGTAGWGGEKVSCGVRMYRNVSWSVKYKISYRIDINSVMMKPPRGALSRMHALDAMTGSDARFAEPLRSALRDGRLVVFAGAGVPMGSPGLPDLTTLAGSIAKGSGET